MLTPETSLDDGRIVLGPRDRTSTEFDPVCGMEVKPESPVRADFQGQTYGFCSDECRQKFLAQPEAFVKPAADH